VSYRDEWSLDSHLARQLLEALPRFKNDGDHGQAVIFCERLDWSMPEENGLTKKQAKKMKREQMDLWDMKVDAIWSALYDWYEEYDFTCEPLAHTQRVQAGWKLFGEMAQGFWW
jgi:hypothetical protein